MTSRERVYRCLEQNRPDRAPRELWWIPIAEIQHGKQNLQAFIDRWPSDFACPFVAQKCLENWPGSAYDVGTYVDPWGCKFENIQAGVHGEVKTPLIDDYSKLQDWQPPHQLLDLDLAGIRAQCAATDKFRLSACCPRPFERLQFLRGSENVFMDLAEGSSDLMELLRRIHDFHLKEMEIFAKLDVDALFFMDDWGSQRALLISPELWRRIFKPLYADYCRIARDNGKKIFMHSDGFIFDIYEDLIEIGVDAINSQLFCMDVEEIGRRYKGRITFWGEIDRQYILPFGTVAEARAAVQRVVDNLWSPAGGVIAQFELTAGAKMANADEIYRTFDELTTITR